VLEFASQYRGPGRLDSYDLGMNALSAFVERLFFAVTCVLGWVVFPMFIVVGGTALLIYASIAEVFSTMMGAAAPLYRNRLDARRAANRICGPLRP
jgi:hypothetical protein